MSPAATPIAERLNRNCHCIGTDIEALRARIEHDLSARGLVRPIIDSHPHLFSPLPVFVARAHTDGMQRIVAAIESVIASQSWRTAVLADAAPIARHDPHALGVFMGYDFHIGDQGPQLIEINTNAGGAYLNAALGQVQRACCPEVRDWVTTPADMQSIEQGFVAMFANEWRLARGARPLRRIAIVDTAPASQYLYPEFLLAQQAFESRGIAAVIADPAGFALRNGHLEYNGETIDLVYNRLTDFYFDDPAHALLREAYVTDAAVFTPHPRAHALYANKHNLVLLTDAALLRRWGIDEATIATLIAGIPRTVRVRAEDAESLWADRKHWFFKPAGGFGSRGAYRGDKLTKKVFAEILASDYVAQAIAVPGERHLTPEQPLKIDIRNYVYDGQVQLVAARLYQGQTTNFRTPGGGFAPVYHPPRHAPD